MSKIRYADIASITNLDFGKSDLTLKDIKREVVARGMNFTEVLSLDIPRLSRWLVDNVLVKKDDSLLDKFDDWMDAELIKRGREDLVHRSFRLGYIGERSDDDEKIKTPKVIKEKKPPREKNELGLYKGTKKAYTFELQGKGKSLQQVITKVTRKYPGSQEKSIKIWYNKSKKLNGN